MPSGTLLIRAPQRGRGWRPDNFSLTILRHDTNRLVVLIALVSRPQRQFKQEPTVRLERSCS